MAYTPEQERAITVGSATNNAAQLAAAAGGTVEQIVANFISILDDVVIAQVAAQEKHAYKREVDLERAKAELVRREFGGNTEVVAPNPAEVESFTDADRTRKAVVVVHWQTGEPTGEPTPDWVDQKARENGDFKIVDTGEWGRQNPKRPQFKGFAATKGADVNAYWKDR